MSLWAVPFPARVYNPHQCNCTVDARTILQSKFQLRPNKGVLKKNKNLISFVLTLVPIGSGKKGAKY